MSKPKKQAGPTLVRVCRDVEAVRDQAQHGPVIGPLDVWAMLRHAAANYDQESIYVIALDTRMRPKGFQEVTRGTLSAAPVHAREVFRVAVLLGANSVIVCHNHPAGSLKPSKADQDVTKELVEAGDTLGVPLTDHVIVTESGYYSFAEHGAIRGGE